MRGQTLGCCWVRLRVIDDRVLTGECSCMLVGTAVEMGVVRKLLATKERRLREGKSIQCRRTHEGLGPPME